MSATSKRLAVGTIGEASCGIGCSWRSKRSLFQTCPGETGQVRIDVRARSSASVSSPLEPRRNQGWSSAWMSGEYLAELPADMANRVRSLFFGPAINFRFAAAEVIDVG